MAKKKARAGGMTKIEAVRQAVAVLGQDAKPLQIQGWVKNKFGIDMNTDHISTCLGDVRKKVSAKPAVAHPAVAQPEPKKEAPAATPAGAISKAEAVRRVMDDLGWDAMPTRIAATVKARFGIDMTPNYVSDCKSKIHRKGAAKAKPPARRPAVKPVAGKPVAAKPLVQPSAAASKPQAKPAPLPDGIGLRDIETVKDLMERVGAPSLRKLIDVMTK